MNTGKIKTLFIINPILEKKTGGNAHALISRHLDHSKFDATILHSEYAGHAGILTRENAGKYQLIVAGGGDGTVNQVAHSLVHSETILGILPLGSGKGLARSLGIPLQPGNAIRILNRLNIKRIDSGLAGTHRFFNIAGIGFAAMVAHTYSNSKKRGFFAYARSSAKNLPGFRPVSMEISTGDRCISDRFFLVSLANAAQWGYGAYISPMSRPDDGSLDICIIRDFPKLLVPVLLTRIFTKTIHRSKYVEAIRVKNAVISGNGAVKGHIDGEPVEFTLPLKVSLEKDSLRVVSKDRNETV
jgi:YegS/Rv2252/BmrU family lipid kinase